MAFGSGNKMRRSGLAILLLSLPGLLSAICSNPPQPPQQYIPDPQFLNAENPPGIQESFDTSNQLQSDPKINKGGEDCKNGWCAEDGSCICNPCWSGPTCQEYVDRFAPRFLSEEPFFIVDASPTGYSAFLDPAFDPIYPPFAYSSDFVDPAPAWTTNPYSPSSQSSQQPLFRIESADDDLGLTCQLGQVGPAATCPCATPRYKVVGATTTFPLKSKDKESPYYGDMTVTHDDHPVIRDKEEDGHRKRKVQLENESESHPSVNPFWADKETGDVFLQKGFKLQPRKHYFITLQVSALPVNNSGFKPWKEEVVATLYVRPTEDKDHSLTSNGFDTQLSVGKEQEGRDNRGKTSITSDISSQGNENLLNDSYSPNKQKEPTTSTSMRFPSTNPLEADGNTRQNLGVEMNYGNIVQSKRISNIQQFYKDDGDLVSYFYRRKRETTFVSPNEFQAILSKLGGDDENISAGEVIKMQLLIRFPPVDSVDFDVEILSMKGDPRFAILSAHVSSISSDISFDKDHTNLVPILKPSMNTSLHHYHSATWHWRGVSRRKNHQKYQQGLNRGITIEFDMMAVSDSNPPLLRLPSLSGTQNPPRTNAIPFGKMTQDFNNMYLVPIYARLTIPHLPHGSSSHQPRNKSSAENISQRHFPVIFPNTSDADSHPLEDDVEVEENMNKEARGKQPKDQPCPLIIMDGPHEMSQGDWKSYRVKTYFPSKIHQFKLTIQQIEGNEVTYQDLVSVEDIRLAKSSCKRATNFSVSCYKRPSEERKGDLCTMTYKCGAVNAGRRPFSFLQQTDEEKKNEEEQGEDTKEENVVISEAIIYALPTASPDSQFVLRAQVETTRCKVEAKLFGKITKRISRRKGKEVVKNGGSHISKLPDNTRQSRKRTSRASVSESGQFHGADSSSHQQKQSAVGDLDLVERIRMRRD